MTSTKLRLRPSKERRHATLGQVSSDGNRLNKLDPILELHRIPETTKNDENFGVEIPAAASSVQTCGPVNLSNKKSDARSSNFSGSFP